MYKSLFNLRNFKKGLRLIEAIAKQNDEHAVDYACGYAVATIKAQRKGGRITKNQEKALVDLAYETADETIAEILKDVEVTSKEDLKVLDLDLEEA